MSCDDLNIFRQVASDGSFTKAAASLGRPKSSVSTAVSRLEAHLGLRLLERSTRRIRLTDAGMHLFNDCGEHMDALHDLILSAQTQGRSISGTLRLAAPYEFGAHHLSLIAAELLTKHKELRVSLDVKYGPVDLFDANYDIVFSMTDRELPDSTAVIKRVIVLNRGIFASPELLRKYEEPATLGDLTKFPILCSEDEKMWQFSSGDGQGGTSNFEIDKPRLISANADFRKRAALEGIGIFRVTSTFCESEVETGLLKKLLPDLECQPLKIFAMMPARRLTLPRVRLFLNTLTANKNTYMQSVKTTSIVK